MDNRLTRILFICTFLAISSSVAAQSLQDVNYLKVFNNWGPVITLSMLVAVGITLLYYGMAVIIGNSRLRALAINEFSNVMGTIIIIVIILGFLTAYGSLIFSMDKQAASDTVNMCDVSLASSQVNFLNSQQTTSPTYAVCQLLEAQGGGGTVTSNLNYGVAAAYVILANVTNQDAVNLNALNIFEYYFTELGQYTAQNSVCVTPTVTVCTGLNITYSYSPFFYYKNVRSGIQYILTEATVSFYIGLLEMLVIIIMIFGWPYILAAGFIMRSTFLTRRAGGLLIAVVIVWLFIFPFLNLFEYSALTNAPSLIGPSSLPGMQLIGLPYSTFGVFGTQQQIIYNANDVNFYVLPRLDYILNNDGCWPDIIQIGGHAVGGVLGVEAELTVYYSTPAGFVFNLISKLTSTTGYTVPQIPFVDCTNPTNLVNSLLDAANFYGMVFPFAVLIPVLNILMMLAAIKGLSSLMGGDTSILGLGRLV